MGLLGVKKTSKLVQRSSLAPHVIKKDSSSTSDCQDDSIHVIIHQDCTTSTNNGESNKICESIPEYLKSDLLIGKHLGKGTFSDVFEVTAVVSMPNEKAVAERRHSSVTTEETLSEENDDLDRFIDSKFSKFVPFSDREKKNASLSASDHDVRAAQTAKNNQQGIAASICIGSLPSSSRPIQKCRMTYAMKCLRPQVRSDAEQFKVGIEDLVRETQIIASLEHPNIVKLHGRMAGCDGNIGSVTASFHVSNGYFILLDRLTNTLEERIECWKRMPANKKAPLSLIQAKTAYSIADAISYLHSKNIIYRDLKSANVGFDSKGVLRLFDFGFAAIISKGSSSKASTLLYDQAGTMRYMSPEVGLQLGHSFPADVYSFGILLWELFALKKPYKDIKSSVEFHRLVFEEDTRPRIKKTWPDDLKNLMADCWTRSSVRRPTMDSVKAILCAYVQDLSSTQVEGQQMRKPSLFRRLSVDF